VYDSAESTAESGSVPAYIEETADPHNASKTLQIDSKPSVGWTIAGNVQNTYSSDGDVTYTITLPDDVTLASEQTKFYKKVSGNLTEITDGSMSLSGNTITVSPEARLDGTTPTEFRIMLKAYINDLSASMASAGGSAVTDGAPFELNVTDSLNAEMNQIQSVKQTVISKSAIQQYEAVTIKDEYDQEHTINGKSHFIDYTIDINPNAQTLNGGDPITVYDHLYYDTYQGVRAFLTSFEVWVYENGTSRKLGDNEYTYSASNAAVENNLSATLNVPGIDVDIKGAWFYIKVDDEKHYQVRYTYHYLRYESSVPDYNTMDGKHESVYNIAKMYDSDGKELSESEKVYLKFKFYNYDSGDDYAVIEAVSEDNYNVKIPGCRFAFLKYNASEKKWYVMTDAEVDPTTQKITPTAWGDYTEIKQGDTPEKVVAKNHCYLLDPTDERGRTRLPEMTEERVYYRVVEVQPADGYAVNPDKMYLTYLNWAETSQDNIPNNAYFDRITSIFKYDTYHNNMVGTVIVDNTVRKNRDITMKKDWIDSWSGTHEDVTFNVFRSYETKSRENVKTITFELFDKDNNSIGGKKTFYVSNGGTFTISIQNSGIPTYAYDTQFYVRSGSDEKTVTATHASNPWYQEQDGIYQATLRNRLSDDESIIYYSYPSGRSSALPPGISNETDASVWCNNVTRDYDIQLRVVSQSVNADTVISYPILEKGDYDTYDNLPEEDSRLEIDSFKSGETSPVTIGEVGINGYDPWTYTWHDLPALDCYGFKYYYYVEEMPEQSGETADGMLKRKYGKDYEVRYFNNGAIDGDTIAVRNHEKSFIKSLPATGGEGRDIIIGMGLSLISCAGVLLFLRKRSCGRKCP
jgi:LPXTG-motif cell wall-anchored protein